MATLDREHEILLASVAHDFNNNLAVIASYADLVLAAMPDADPNRADVAEIRRAADRAMRLARRMLAYSGHRPELPAPLDLAETMERVQKALRSVVGNKVELEVELARGVALVEADPVLVEQVLLNLALNARDAMPEGGRLRLAVGVAEPCSASCATASGCRYPCARLTVEDNGSGMDDATRARIFEPFFTTKSKGKGTGLGLSIVQDIVEKAKGHVEVQSAPGEGTRFDIYLPRLATA